MHYKILYTAARGFPRSPCDFLYFHKLVSFSPVKWLGRGYLLFFWALQKIFLPTLQPYHLLCFLKPSLLLPIRSLIWLQYGHCMTDWEVYVVFFGIRSSRLVCNHGISIFAAWELRPCCTHWSNDLQPAQVSGAESPGLIWSSAMLDLWLTWCQARLHRGN